MAWYKRKTIALITILCLLSQAGGLMLFLHIHTDSVHHHLCKADHADHKEKPEGKSSRHSECPICLQFILVLGKYIIEPTFVIENLAEIAYRISIPFSVTISSSHHQSIRPRSPPCG